MKSNLNRKVSGKLTTPYNSLALFFFRRSVEKAFQLDESPTGLSLNPNHPIDGNAPYIISAVDDVMYIVSTIIQKAMSTLQREITASVIPDVGRVLGSDFIGMIQRRLRDESYPQPTVHGGLPPENKIISFIVLTNSLDVAKDYLARIITSQLGDSADGSNGTSHHHPLATSYPFEHDVTFVISALNSLNSTFSIKASELISNALRVLFTNVVKQRLKPVLVDAFRDADYWRSEEELAEIARQNDEDEDEIIDRVQRRFEHGWDALMKPIGRLMTPRTFTALIDLTASDLSKTLEKRVWSYGGKTSAYGAIRMDRDFSGIVSTVARGNYSVRELFAKVTQILMVANMEEEEWEELSSEEGEDSIQWVLNEDERRRARNLVKS